jgi:hypothetical protein
MNNALNHINKNDIDLLINLQNMDILMQNLIKSPLKIIEINNKLNNKLNNKTIHDEKTKYTTPDLSETDIKMILEEFIRKYNILVIFIEDDSNLMHPDAKIMIKSIKIEDLNKYNISQSTNISQYIDKFKDDTNRIPAMIINIKKMIAFNYKTIDDLKIIISHEIGHILTIKDISIYDRVEYEIKNGMFGTILNTVIDNNANARDQELSNISAAYYHLKPEKLANDIMHIDFMDMINIMHHIMPSKNWKDEPYGKLAFYKIPKEILIIIMKKRLNKTLTMEERVLLINETIKIYEYITMGRSEFDHIINKLKQTNESASDIQKESYEWKENIIDMNINNIYNEATEPRLYNQRKDLPMVFQIKLNQTNKFIVETLQHMIRTDKYKSVLTSEKCKEYIDKFCTPLSEIDDNKAVQIWPTESGKYQCMIQITGHVVNDRNDTQAHLFHTLITEVFNKVKPIISKKYDLRLEYEFNDGHNLEGYDVYPSDKIAEQLWNKFKNRGNVVDNHIKTEAVDINNYNIKRAQFLKHKSDNTSFKNKFNIFTTNNDNSNKPKTINISKDNLPPIISTLVDDLNKQILTKIKDKVKKSEYSRLSEKHIIDEIEKYIYSSITGCGSVTHSPQNNSYSAVIYVTDQQQTFNFEDAEYELYKKMTLDEQKSYRFLHYELYLLLQEIDREFEDGRVDFQQKYPGITIVLGGDPDDGIDMFELRFDDDAAKKLWDYANNGTPYIESTFSVAPENCEHSFSYGGGQARCVNCGWYLQPDNRLTKTPGGRGESMGLNKIDKAKIATAKQTILTLAKSIIDKSGKVSESTLNTIANLISEGPLREWASEFDAISIGFTNDKSDIDFEFIPPNLSIKKNGDNIFVDRFINGHETFTTFLRRSGSINIKVSKKLFKTFKTPDDLLNCFENAIKYYNSNIDKGAEKIAMNLMKFDTPTKKLLIGPLDGVVIYTLSMLLVFRDVDGEVNKVFNPDMELIDKVNKFISDIVETYPTPEKSKKKIIHDLKSLISQLTTNVTYTETVRSLQSLPQIVERFYNSGFDTEIELYTSRFEYAQCEKYIEDKMVFNEKVKIKRLKKIPADLVAYITIEGESIRTANDKMMIVSYAYGKLEIVEWYIELLDVGTKNYIVPHTYQYLVDMRTQLLAAIKNIMDMPVPSADRPIIDIKYPKNYEG